MKSYLPAMVSIITVAAILLLSTTLTDVTCGSNNNNVYDHSSFDILLLDEEKNEIKTLPSMMVYYDTNVKNDTIYFKMKSTAMTDSQPFYLYIESKGGLFNVSVSTLGLNTYLKESGLEFTIDSDIEKHVCNVGPLANQIDYFMNGEEVSELSPNTMYKLSITTWHDGIESVVIPEDMDNVILTFTASVAKGFHQVSFFSDGEMIDTYKVRDGEAITEFPPVPPHTGTFKGWFTPNGVQIYDGYIVSPEDEDIIANATWEESNNSMLYIIIGGISAAILGSLLIVFIRKRKGES